MSEERAEYVVAGSSGAVAALCPCPFCGAVPKIEPWGLNGARRSIDCPNDECPAMPMVTAKSEAEVVALWNTRFPSAPSAPPREISPEGFHPGDLVRISKHSHHHSGCVGHVTDIDAMADGTMYLVRNKHGKCWCTRDELRKEVEA